jgi:hypothetical protein
MKKRRKRTRVMKNWLDETGKLKPEILRRFALIGVVIGAVVWGAVAVAAAIMLVSLGLWGWVVWPFASYWWIGHIGKAVKSYNSIVKPQKWEQNVTVNVYPDAGMSGEKIAEAAERAVNERLLYGA